MPIPDTYQLLTFISEPSNPNFSNLVVQKFTPGRETLKMKVVSGLELCNFLFNTARIIHADTYDSGVFFVSKFDFDVKP